MEGHLAVKRPLRGRVSYDDAEGGGTVVYLGAPIHSGYALIPRAHLVNVTSLEHERWKRAHPKFCRQMASGRSPVRLRRVALGFLVIPNSFRWHVLRLSRTVFDGSG